MIDRATTDPAQRDATVEAAETDAARGASVGHPPGNSHRTNAPYAGLERGLAALERRNRRRALTHSPGLDFTSNDYLALAGSAELREAVANTLRDPDTAIGAGGSRLLRGNHDHHMRLEEQAAQHFGSESALFFAGGFAANAAVFATLPQRGDLVIHDERIHASVHDGLAQTKAAHKSARHNDVDAIDTALKAWRRTAANSATAWIAVESLYSMDGDFAPLDDLANVADRHGTVLVIDEAHATAVFGPDGCGLAAHLEGRDHIITLHTCGKALGVMGGLVCAPKIVTDYLVNRARGFIYATAPSPLLCAAVSAALDITGRNTTHRDALAAHTRVAGTRLAEAIGFDPSPSQIKPVILGSERDAVIVADDLQNEGFDVRPIRPPTVPDGSARLRISITLNVSNDDIGGLTQALADTLTRRGIEARRP